MADSSQSLDSAKTRDEEDEETNRRSLSAAMFVVPKKKQKVIPLYEANRVDTDTLVMQFSPPMLEEKCDPKEEAVPIQKLQQQREPSNGIRSKERHSSSSSIGASAASAMRSLKSAARAAISVLSPVVETPATPTAMSPQKTRMPETTTNLLMSPIHTREKATRETLETNSRNDEVSRIGDLDNNDLTADSDDEEVDALVLRMQSPKGRGGQRRQRKRIQRQYAASLRGDNMIFRTQTAPTPPPRSDTTHPVHEQPKKRKLPAKVSP